MAERAFRFSVGIHSVKSRTALQDKAKRLEDIGFDALHLPDHLGAPAPFPALTAIASGDLHGAAGHLCAQCRLLQTRAAGP